MELDKQQGQLDAMQSAIFAFRDYRKQSDQVEFNIFSLVNLGTDEVSHSAFLSWLLDAKAGHRQGNLFLKSFLAVCYPKISLTISDEYNVQTEFAGSHSRIDILIYQAKSFLLYIENKTISPDTPGQHDREISDMRRVGAMLDVPESAQFAIYLTPDGRRARGDQAHHWRHVAYSDIGEAFDNLLPHITEDKVQYVLADWLDTILTFTGTWRQSMTGFSDKSVLVAENWDTITDIMCAKERINDELTEILFSVEADLKESEWWNHGWEFRRYETGTGIYIYNRNWVDPEGYAVLWIGISSSTFDSTHIFGLKSPPLFYVRTRKDAQDLKQVLMENLRAADHTVTKEKWYFIGRDIQKCAKESQAIKKYPQRARKQIIDLFEQYANLMTQFDKAIRQYCKSLQTASPEE